LTLWTLPLAGVLIIASHEAWTWQGLLGGGIYLCFGGRGLLTRLEMRRRGHRIGEPANVRLALAMCAVWATAGSITVIAAAVALARPTRERSSQTATNAVIIAARSPTSPGMCATSQRRAGQERQYLGRPQEHRSGARRQQHAKDRGLEREAPAAVLGGHGHRAEG
jgi:hypothetical protein